jgi:hypothetical protein
MPLACSIIVSDMALSSCAVADHIGKVVMGALDNKMYAMARRLARLPTGPQNEKSATHRAQETIVAKTRHSMEFLLLCFFLARFMFAQRQCPWLSVCICEATFMGCSYFYSLEYGRIADSWRAHDDAVSAVRVHDDAIVTGSWDASVKVCSEWPLDISALYGRFLWSLVPPSSISRALVDLD